MAFTTPGRSLVLQAAFFLLTLSPIIAQRSDNGAAPATAQRSPLDGHDMIGLYAGGNATLLGIEDSYLYWLPKATSLRDPSGFGSEFGITYARLMPDFFVTTPTSDTEASDPERLYRHITTFELRLLYSRLDGSSTNRTTDEVGSSSGYTLRYHSTIAIVEPRLCIDLAPMRSPSSLHSVVGFSFGHIAQTYLRTESPNMISQGTQDRDLRSFYAAMIAGFGYRISLGKTAYSSPSIVPEAVVIIPLTSLAIQPNWLPFGVRAGVALHWPL